MDDKDIVHVVHISDAHVCTYLAFRIEYHCLRSRHSKDLMLAAKERDTYSSWEVQI